MSDRPPPGLREDPVPFPPGLDPGLVAIMARPSDVSMARVWSLVPLEDRVRTLEVVLRNDEGGGFTRRVQEMVASRLNFRIRSVRGWPAERLARRAAGAPGLGPSWLELFLRTLHLSFRRPVMSTYLDQLGIPHDDGELVMEVGTDVAPDRARSAFIATAIEHSPREALVYLLSLRELQGHLATGVNRWLPDLVPAPASRELPEPGEEEPVDLPGAERGEVEPDRLERTPSFTTLDQVVIRAVVHAVQGVEGALDEERIDDLVGELLELNGERHRSHFHLGFVDGLRDHPRRAELPAENEDRRRWYLAGLVTGLGRRRRWTPILEALDGEPLLREMGRSPSPAAAATAPLLLEALLRNDRMAEVPDVLPPELVLATPGPGRALLRAATLLLREGRAGEARPLLELLRAGIDAARAAGEEPRRRFELEVRRRQAHVHRHLGEFDAARVLLEQLLEDDPDPGIRAMVLADLGLVAGGFRSLADIRVPEDVDGRVSLRERIERGEEFFRQAAAIPNRFAGHGHYGLGMLEMLQAKPPGSWEGAADHLERALNTFEAVPGRYDPTVLLPTARLHLGIALALTLEPSRAPRAFDLLEATVEAGALPRTPIVPDLLEALALLDRERAGRLAETLVRSGREGMLDALVRSPLSGSAPAVADALFLRAMGGSRGETERARDLRAAVPLLLGGDVERAREALDLLEELAMKGVGRREFQGLLEDPGHHEPAWGAEEVAWVRVRLLEADGRYVESAALLESEFHRILSEAQWGAEDDAEAVLDRLQATGAADAARIVPLRARLDAVREVGERDGGPAEGRGDRPRVRVLFVGGDERQAREQGAIREELARTHPHIEVNFIHPGWSGNWGGTLAEVLRRSRDHDAAVIMRFVRTEFGRALRRGLDIPWRFCYGAGRKRMVGSIIRAGGAG